MICNGEVWREPKAPVLGDQRARRRFHSSGEGAIDEQLIDNDVMRRLVDKRAATRRACLSMRHRMAEDDDAIGETRESKAAIDGHHLVPRLLQVDSERT